MRSFEESLKICATEHIEKWYSLKKEKIELESNLAKLKLAKNDVGEEDADWLDDVVLVEGKIQKLEQDLNLICLTPVILKIIDDITKQAEERRNGGTLVNIPSSDIGFRTTSSGEAPATALGRALLIGIGAIGNENVVHSNISNSNITVNYSPNDRQDIPD